MCSIQLSAFLGDDGYLEATKVAALFNKRFENFHRKDATQTFILHLQTMHPGVAIVKRYPEGQGKGSLIHPSLALEFIRFVDATLFSEVSQRFLRDFTLPSSRKPDPEEDMGKEIDLKIEELRAQQKRDDLLAEKERTLQSQSKERDSERQLEILRLKSRVFLNDIQGLNFSEAQKLLIRFVRERCEVGSSDPRDGHYVPLSLFEKHFAKVYEKELKRKYHESVPAFYEDVFLLYFNIRVVNECLNWPVENDFGILQRYIIGLALKV